LGHGGSRGRTTRRCRELAKQVVTALHDDPYFPDMRVIVMNSGVVWNLQGVRPDCLMFTITTRM
jgi:hypothetical protein